MNRLLVSAAGVAGFALIGAVGADDLAAGFVLRGRAAGGAADGKNNCKQRNKRDQAITIHEMTTLQESEWRRFAVLTAAQ